MWPGAAPISHPDSTVVILVVLLELGWLQNPQLLLSQGTGLIGRRGGRYILRDQGVVRGRERGRTGRKQMGPGTSAGLRKPGDQLEA